MSLSSICRCLGAFLLFCSLPITAAQSTFGNNTENPPIRFVGDKDYPPVEWLEDGQPRGIFTSFLAEYSKALNRTIEYDLMDWKRAQREVLAGRADVLTVFSPNPERIKNYAFVDSFLRFDISLFLRSDDLTIHGLADLKGVAVGVTKGGFPRQILSTQSAAKLVTIKNHLDGFEKLIQGEIDALATTKWVGAYVIQKNKLSGIKFLPQPIATKATHMGVRKEDVELVKVLQAGITQMEQQGTLEGVNQQWSGHNMVYLTENKLNQMYYLFAVAALIIFVALAGFAIVVLKRQVKDRTHSLLLAKTSLEETIDDLTRTQKQLVQAEKMVGLNSIVTGVAHEINTPLGMAVTLSSTLDELVENLNNSLKANTLTKQFLSDFISDSKDSLRLEMEALQRTVNLLDNFKQIVAKQKHEQKQTIQIAEIIDDAIVIAKQDQDNTQVSLVMQGDESLCIESYAAPLAQSLTHMIRNAYIHAFAEQDSPEITISFARDETNLLLQVADNGCGIAEQHLSKLFDPFYTTSLGKGSSGLGLSIVYSIINHVLGGSIKVKSRLGEGTQFILELPLIAPEINLEQPQ